MLDGRGQPGALVAADGGGDQRADPLRVGTEGPVVHPGRPGLRQHVGVRSEVDVDPDGQHFAAALASVTDSVAAAAAAVSEIADSSRRPGKSVKPLTSLVTRPYS